MIGVRKFYFFTLCLILVLALAYIGALKDQNLANTIIGLGLAFAGGNAGEHFAKKPQI